MKFLVVVLVSLSLASATPGGSFVSINQGGSSFGYQHGAAPTGAPAPPPPPAPAPAHAPAPVFQEQSEEPLFYQGPKAAAPAAPAPAPAPAAPAPAYPQPPAYPKAAYPPPPPAPQPAYPQPQPAYPKAAYPPPTPAPQPAYPQPAPQPAYPQPAPQPAYPKAAYPQPEPAQPKAAYPQPPAYPKAEYPSYEEPKQNCSVSEVVESAEVCTPTLESKCEKVEVKVKKVVEAEVCQDITKTVCTESTEEIPNEICTYTYQVKKDKAPAKSAEVTFKQESKTQMVTVCSPGYGPPPAYGSYGGYEQPKYSHQVCNEVAQTTSFNTPVVAPKDVEVEVKYPEAVKQCVNKPIKLPRIKCEPVTEKKCGKQPQIEEVTESIEKCTVALGKPSCQKVDLTLPKQTCIDLVYGYAEEKPHYG